MSPHDPFQLSRRGLLATAGAAAAMPASALAAAAAGVLTRPIPVSGERLPVIGSGSAIIYDFENDPAKYAERRATLQAFVGGGAKLIDTAPSYGKAEDRLGDLIADLGIRDRLFVATKVPAQDSVEAKTASLAASQRRMKMQRFDLMQAWNVSNPNLDLAQLREWKARGVTRYWGITSSFDQAYPAVEAVIRREKPDFLQIDYSLGNRNAEERLLPAARDNNVAVLTALPFGRNSLFAKTRNMPLPDWATNELGATSWAQVFLKWLLGHPNITAVIPGTDKPEYAVDNIKAGAGRLPDAVLRQRIVQWWESLPA